MSFTKNKAIPLFESWGYEVVIVQAEQDYLDLFYHVIENPRSTPSNKGKRSGFPITGLCAVKRDLKVAPLRKYLRSLNEPYHQYVGICSDEPARLASLNKQSNASSLLEEYNYTQEMARELCQDYGLLSPLYELTKRGGCWFCPFAKLAEVKAFREQNPEAWKRFVALENEDNLACTKWNLYGPSLRERDRLLDSL